MGSEVCKLIDLLRLVSEEDLDCELAQGIAEKLDWPSMPEVGDVYGNLFHYWHDEDIRERDEVYRDMQDTELSRLIKHLESGDFKNAGKVSFLHDSGSS